MTVLVNEIIHNLVFCNCFCHLRMSNYDEIFEWYVQHGSGEIGVNDIQKFTSGLPAGAKILDLGCGDGFPISSYLAKQGFDLFAIDSSKKMIDRYRQNFPGVQPNVQKFSIHLSSMFVLMLS
jgi:2-polyprenyl-3-methyl-5-hydroxy-6-metoxy-1,4-benzoquinol methylase